MFRNTLIYLNDALNNLEVQTIISLKFKFNQRNKASDSQIHLWMILLFISNVESLLHH
jgi:hypothetical protein